MYMVSVFGGGGGEGHDSADWVGGACRMNLLSEAVPAVPVAAKACQIQAVGRNI